MESVNMDKPKNSHEPKSAAIGVRLVVRFIIYTGVLVVIWRLTSGSWVEWYGWFYIALDVALGILAAIWVPITPEMEQERTTIKEGVKQWDKYIVIPMSLWYPLGILVLAGLDSRYGWSNPIPVLLVIIASILAVGGRVFSTWAAASNPFYGRFVRIQTDRGHLVVEEGPYRIVRHPGYSGLLIFLLCAGMILHSWWTVIGNLVVAGMLILRTSLEDRTLRSELEGYEEYVQRVRFRLIPGLW
jgi:protein-S-isoprenylcysteine O-methyltransferase Ste14